MKSWRQICQTTPSSHPQPGASDDDGALANVVGTGRSLLARVRPARRRPAVRPARGLQPGRSLDHGARAQLREGDAQPAQLPLSDVLLLRAVRLGRRLPRVGVAERPGRVHRALQQLYFTDPTGIYTAGRALGVVAGTATIAALYGLAARLTDHRTAIAAAVFLAVAPLARPRLALREARCAGNAGSRHRLPGDDARVAVCTCGRPPPA